MTTEITNVVQFKDFLKNEKILFMERFRMNVECTKTFTDFKPLAILGVGSFGKVLLVQEKETEVYLAMKLISKKHTVESGQVEHTLYEKRILQSVNFPFLVSLHYFIIDNSNLYFLMPYITGGELYHYLQEEGPFSESHIRFYAAQIILALQYLHNVNIIYRDLKPENILIDDKGYIKLTDFGLAKLVQGRTYTMCGTPDYIAPEIILSKGYGKSVDYWSFGILLYELYLGQPPFNGPSLLKLYESITRVKYKMPTQITDEFKSLLKQLIIGDISKRLGNLKDGIEGLKKHKWFNGVNWLVLLNYGEKAPYIPELKDPADAGHFHSFHDMFEVQVSKDDLFKHEFQAFYS